MEENNNTFNFLLLIFLVMFTAKVTGCTDWEWWVIFIPLFPFILGTLLVALVVVIGGIIAVAGILITIIGFLISSTYYGIKELINKIRN